MKLAACLLALSACADPPAPPAGPAGVHLEGEYAAKILRARGGWLALLEVPQAQALVTTPTRRAVLFDDALAVPVPLPAAGPVLIDAAVHPSGDVTTIAVGAGGATQPLQVFLSRQKADGTRLDADVPTVAPVDPSLAFVSSLDRVRVAADGEDVLVAIRWAGNAVVLSRYDRDLHERWATPVEPEAPALFVGIIGGGYDNFHQGDETSFVHLAVDDGGAAFVAVRSTADLLPVHERVFGEDLGDDPGTALLTRVDADGTRHASHLVGVPGTANRLIGMRAGHDSVLVFGRTKTGTAPEAWDAWLAVADPTGVERFERTIDVSRGDMFWDAAPLADGRVMAVGSTDYTQNPTGLSVSDTRSALGVVLDENGAVAERLTLPHGAGSRGDEAISVAIDGETVATAGMLDGPGTHAAVSANGFVDLQPLP